MNTKVVQGHVSKIFIFTFYKEQSEKCGPPLDSTPLNQSFLPQLQSQVFQSVCLADFFVFSLFYFAKYTPRSIFKNITFTA